jgi:hypothetical protein
MLRFYCLTLPSGCLPAPAPPWVLDEANAFKWGAAIVMPDFLRTTRIEMNIGAVEDLLNEFLV